MIFVWVLLCFLLMTFLFFFFFFFQAEDGIRDVAVTGVQTCALPIFAILGWSAVQPRAAERWQRNLSHAEAVRWKHFLLARHSESVWRSRSNCWRQPDRV